jgi:mono/diheme cytochrome c family protein
MPHDQNIPAQGGIDHSEYLKAHQDLNLNACATCHNNPSRHSPQASSETCATCHENKFVQNKNAHPPATAGADKGPRAGGGNPAAPAGPSQTVKFHLDFKTVNEVVFQPACIKCHTRKIADKRTKPDKRYVSLETFEDVSQDLERIKDSVKGDPPSMPKSGEFTQAQLGLLLAWINAKGPKDSSEDVTVETGPSAGSGAGAPADAAANAPTLDEEALARGKYLFNASACVSCHTSDPAKPLAGGKAFPLPGMGVLYTPNITPDAKTGIGKWTAWDFLRSMRQGVSPDHQYYFPVFPYTNYSQMTDEDIYAVYQYVMSLPAIAQQNRQVEMKLPFLPYVARNGQLAWRFLNFNSFIARTPLAAEGPMRPDGNKRAFWNRGAYLVEGPMHCTQCHTPRDPILFGLKTDQWFAGAESPIGGTAAPNLTPDPETGLNNWTEKDWVSFLGNGKVPARNGKEGYKVADADMWQFITDVTKPLTYNDKVAVATYMMSLRPIRNERLKAIIAKKKAEDEGAVAPPSPEKK